MSHLVKRTNVIDFEAARVRRHALTIAKREAQKHFLSPDETLEALAWAAYIATWVTFPEVERMVTEFCAGVFAFFALGALFGMLALLGTVLRQRREISFLKKPVEPSPAAPLIPPPPV